MSEIKGFRENLLSLVTVIESSLEERHFLPCLALIYTGIDVMASLDKNDDDGVKVGFVRWVERYMLASSRLTCTALELYAARCGILHTFTADSVISQKGQARKITYAWGTAKAKRLDIASSHMGRQDLVCVHIADLKEAFKLGITNYLDTVAQDQEQLIRFLGRHNSWLTQLDAGVVELVVEGMTGEAQDSDDGRALRT